MFQTPTTTDHTIHNTTYRTTHRSANRSTARRNRRPIAKAAGLLAGLALTSSACGTAAGTPTADAADLATPGMAFETADAADRAPSAASDASARDAVSSSPPDGLSPTQPTDTDGATSVADSDSIGDGSSAGASTGDAAPTGNAPSGNSSSTTGTGGDSEGGADAATSNGGDSTGDTDETTADGTDSAGSGSEGDDSNAGPGDAGPSGPGDPAPSGNTGPLPAADLASLRISAPELAYAQACFGERQSLVWVADGTNEMRLNDYLGNETISNVARTPLSATRQDNGGPLLSEGFSTTIDQHRGFLLSYEINGTFAGIDVQWEGYTTADGGQTSPTFVSESNPLCFVKVGFRATIDDIDEPAIVPDTKVSVRNVKIDAAPNCFAGPITTRVFDTDVVPVAVVLDTNGVSDTQFSSQHHSGTELTAGLSELSISDGALTAYATEAAGYVVTVQMQGFLTGGIVLEWATTVTEAGLQTSPVFSSAAGDCDVTVNFLVVETSI